MPNWVVIYVDEENRQIDFMDLYDVPQKLAEQVAGWQVPDGAVEWHVEPRYLNLGDLRFLDGFIGHVYADEDLPDGAWEAMQQDLIQHALDEGLLHARDVDANTIWHEYLRWKGKRDDKD